MGFPASRWELLFPKEDDEEDIQRRRTISTAAIISSFDNEIVTQSGVEAWVVDVPTERVSQVGIEVWSGESLPAQSSMVGIEVWTRGNLGGHGETPPTLTTPGLVFPLLPGWPIEKRISFTNTVQRGISGREVRALEQSWPIYEWVFTFPVLLDSHDSRVDLNSGIEQLRSLENFFLDVQGSEGLFLYDDPTDDIISGQVIGIGDGITSSFQLVRTMGFNQFREPIVAPNVVSQIYFDGVVPPRLRWFVQPRGLVELSIVPAVGVVVTADFSYRFVTRFSEDSEELENFLIDLWQLGQVKIRSVPGALMTPGNLSALVTQTGVEVWRSVN